MTSKKIGLYFVMILLVSQLVFAQSYSTDSDILGDVDISITKPSLYSRLFGSQDVTPNVINIGDISTFSVSGTPICSQEQLPKVRVFIRLIDSNGKLVDQDILNNNGGLFTWTEGCNNPATVDLSFIPPQPGTYKVSWAFFDKTKQIEFKTSSGQLVKAEIVDFTIEGNKATCEPGKWVKEFDIIDGPDRVGKIEQRTICNEDGSTENQGRLVCFDGYVQDGDTCQKESQPETETKEVSEIEDFTTGKYQIVSGQCVFIENSLEGIDTLEECETDIETTTNLGLEEDQVICSETKPCPEGYNCVDNECYEDTFVKDFWTLTGLSALVLLIIGTIIFGVMKNRK